MASIGSAQFNIGFKIDKSELEKVKSDLLRIMEMGDASGKNLEEPINKAAYSAKNLYQWLNQAYNAKLGTTNIAEFNRQLEASGLTVSELRQSLSAVGEGDVFGRMSSELLSTNLNLKESNELLSKMATTMANTIRWSVTTAILNTFTGSISNAYNYIQRLDTSLNNIRIVTGKSADEMKNFAIQANDAAKALGSQTLEYTNAALIYAQQGLSDEEIQARSEVTIKAANVAQTSAQEMSEYLTAVWNGYRVSAEQAELYVDKLSAVAVSTASDLEELSTGMSKVASVANTLGVDIDQLNGMLSTIISVTRQAPESAGTALKTIFARIEDLSLGETDEEGVDFGDVDAELNKLGISIADETGKLRNLGEVIEEIGAKWQDWTIEQRNAIAVAMAGTRQYTNLFALFENWNIYSEAVRTSAGAMGTLQEQQDIYMESAAAGLKQLQASWDRLYSSIGNGEPIRDIAIALSKIVDMMAEFSEGIGGGLNTLVSVGGIVATLFNKQIAQGIGAATKQVKGFINTTKNVEELEKYLNQVQADINIEKKKGQSGDFLYVRTLEQQEVAVKKILEVRKGLSQEELNVSQEVAKQLSLRERELSKLKQIRDYEDVKLDFSSAQTKKQAYKQTAKDINAYFGDLLGQQEFVDEVLFGEGTFEAIKTRFNNVVKGLKTTLSSDTSQVTTFFEEDALKDIINDLSKVEESISKIRRIDGGYTGNLFKDYEDLENVFEKINEQRTKALQLNTLYSQTTTENIQETIELYEQQMESQRQSIIQQSEAAEQQIKMQKIVQGVTIAIQAMNAAMNLFSVYTNEAAEKSDKLNALASSLSSVAMTIGLTLGGGWGAAIMGGGAALSALLNIIAKDQQKVEEETTKLQERYENLGTTISDINQKILTLSSSLTENKLDTDLVKEFEELSRGVSEYGDNISLTSDEYERYKDIVNQVVGYSDEIVVGYNAEGQAIINKNTAIEDTIRLLKEQRAEELKLLGSDEQQNRIIEEVKKEKEELRKEFEESTQESLEKEFGNFDLNNLGTLAEDLPLYTDYKGIEEDVTRLQELIKRGYAGIVANADEFNSIMERVRISMVGKGHQFYVDTLDAFAPDKIADLAEKFGFEVDKFTDEMTAASQKLNQNILTRVLYSGTGEQAAQLEQLGLTNAFSAYVMSLQIAEDETDEAEQKISNDLDSIIRAFSEGSGRLSQEMLQDLDISRYINIDEWKKALQIALNQFNEDERNAMQILLDVEIADDGTLKTQVDEQINNLQERVNKIAEEHGVTLDITTEIPFGDIKSIQSFLDSFNWDRVSDEASKQAEIDRLTKWIELNNLRLKGYEKLNDAIERLRSEKEISAKDLEELENGEDELQQIRMKNSQEYLDKLIEIREEREDQVSRLAGGKAEAATEQLITAKMDTEEAEQDIKAFFDANSELDVAVLVDMQSDINDVTTELEYLTNVVKEVDEGFIVSADDLYKLGKTFPEVLEGIEYMADGTVKLNEQVLQSALTAAKGEASATVESMVVQMNAMADLYAAKAKIYGRIAELAGELANTEGKSEQEVASLKAQLDGEVTKLKQTNDKIIAESAAEAANSEIDSIQKVAEQSRQTANDFMNHWSSTFNWWVESGAQAASTMATNMANAMLGQQPTAKVSIGTGQVGGVSRVDAAQSTYSGIKESQDKLIDLINQGNYELTQKTAEASKKFAEEAERELRLQAASTEARLNQMNAGFNNVISGKGWSGGKSGGGGSEKEAKDYRDIFHDINIEIELLEKNLKRIQDQEDKLYGKPYLDNLETQLAYYERYNELLREKQKIQEQDLAIRKEDLLTKGVQFNEKGAILNYNELVNLDGMKEAMDIYEKTLYETVEDTKDKLLEIEDAMWEITLKKFTFQVDIEIEVDEARQKWKEFLDEMANYANDNIIDPLKANIDLFSAITEDDSAIVHLTDKVNEIVNELQKGAEGMFAGREAEGLELLDKYQQELMDSLTNINEIQQEIEEAYLKFIDKAKDEFGDHVDQFERLTDILSHQNTLIDLIYGDKSYGLFDEMYQAQHENNIGQLDFYRQQIIFWQQLRDTFEAGTDEWEAANKNLQDTQAALNKLVEESIKNIIEQYNNAVNAIMDAVDNRMTNNLGLDNVGELWDQALYLQNKYLDNTEKIIEQQKLENMFTEAINNTDNLKNQEKLKNVQDYLLKGLREKDKLTQYDVDRAQLLYEIALKEMALEDAKNAKTSMRLVRDTQGNWKYEYTADQDEIDKAQDDLLDTKSDLYKLDKDAYTANLQEMYDIYEEWQEKVRALYADTTLDVEEKERKKKEYAEYYGQLIDEITAQNSEIRLLITSSAFDAIGEVYRQDVENVTGMTDQEMEMIENMTQDFMDNYFMFEQSVKENWDEIHLKTDDTMGEILGIWTSSVQDMIGHFSENEDSFKNVCLDTYDQLDEATEDYRDRLQELEDAAGNNFTNISDSIANTSDETQNLIDFTQELMDAFYDEADAIADLMAQYEDMVAMYEAIKDAAMEAAQAAHEYAEAMREAAAHSVGEGSYDGGFQHNYGGSAVNGGGSGNSSSGSGGSGNSGSYTGGSTAQQKVKRTFQPISYMTGKVVPPGSTWTSGANTLTMEEDRQQMIGKFGAKVDNYLDKYYGPDDPVTQAGWYLKFIKQQVVKAAKGGVIGRAVKSMGEDTMVAARYGERILTQDQNKAFEDFIYNFIPQLTNAIKDFKAQAAYKISSGMSYNSVSNDNSQKIVYEIAEINFPEGNYDAKEIVAALTNLSGAASQYVNTKIR